MRPLAMKFKKLFEHDDKIGNRIFVERRKGVAIKQISIQSLKIEEKYL